MTGHRKDIATKAEQHFRDSSDPAAGFAVAQSYTGTVGDDRFAGTLDDDFADLSQGGKDQFRGLAGDDEAYMGAALDSRDRIVGGGGYDFVDLEGDYSAGLTFAATTIVGIENIGLFGPHDYSLTLNDANVAALASLEIDAVDLGASNHVTIDGSAETNGDLILFGGLENDTLIGGGGNDLFKANGGVDHIVGGAGIDRISFASTPSGVAVDLNDQGAAQDIGFGTLTLSGIESLSGSRYADVFTGDRHDNQFISNGGNDHLDGGGGDDWLVVGVGFDGTVPDAASVVGGSGEDIVDFFANGASTAGVTFLLASQAAQDTGQGAFTVTGVEDVAGTSFADSITGNGRDNIIYGNSGGDRLSGGAGDDILKGDTYLGTDRPSQTTSAPVEFEGAAPGADTLIGGSGADILTGGRGEDGFVFQKITDSTNTAHDRITDFSAGDILDMHAIDADTAKTGNQAFHLGETAGHTGDIVVSYDANAKQTILAIHVDDNASVDMTVVLDGNHVALNNADFVF